MKCEGSLPAPLHERHVFCLSPGKLGFRCGLVPGAQFGQSPQWTLPLPLHRAHVTLTSSNMPVPLHSEQIMVALVVEENLKVPWKWIML